MNKLRMGKDVLLESAVSKFNEISNKDIDSMTPKQKAFLSIELENLYRELDPYRAVSEEAARLAEAFMDMKVKLAESEYKTVVTMEQKRAKVIVQGMDNTPYDIPWLK